MNEEPLLPPSASTHSAQKSNRSNQSNLVPDTIAERKVSKPTSINSDHQSPVDPNVFLELKPAKFTEEEAPLVEEEKEELTLEGVPLTGQGDQSNHWAAQARKGELFFQNPEIVADRYIVVAKEFKLSRFQRSKLPPVLFVFQLKLHNQEWFLYKSLGNFHVLETCLLREFKGQAERKRHVQGTHTLREFHSRSSRNHTNLTNRLETLTKYLQQLAAEEAVCDSNAFREFCEVSSMTFALGEGVTRYKEGWVKKRSGGRFKHEKKLFYMGKCWRVWTIKWLIVTDQYVCYLKHPRDVSPYEVLIIDKGFRYELGDKKMTNNDKTVILHNSSRKLKIAVRDFLCLSNWTEAIKAAMRASPWGPYVERKHDSFAPVRQNCKAEFFIDGHNYYDRLYSELIKAENEVFITDWWLSPKLFLKRPVSVKTAEEELKYAKYRIDNILGALVKKGVQVYILVYKEVEMALNLKSAHTKIVLQEVGCNIIRHPRTLVQLWSHHEKLVIIDQKLGFLGGIDLCFGRYDTNDHPLTDQLEDSGLCHFPGQDYNNAREKDFFDVEQYKKTLVDRDSTVRMPWHDLQICVYGEPAKDLARHFIEYFNHAKLDREGTKSKVKGNLLAPIFFKTNQSQQEEDPIMTQSENVFKFGRKKSENNSQVFKIAVSSQPTQLPMIEEDVEKEEHDYYSVQQNLLVPANNHFQQMTTKQLERNSPTKDLSNLDASSSFNSLDMSMDLPKQEEEKKDSFFDTKRNASQSGGKSLHKKRMTIAPTATDKRNKFAADKEDSKFRKRSLSQILDRSHSNMDMIELQEEDDEVDQEKIPVAMGLPLEKIEEMNSYVKIKLEENQRLFKWTWNMITGQNTDYKKEKQKYMQKYLKKQLTDHQKEELEEELKEEEDVLESEAVFVESMPQFQVERTSAIPTGTCQVQILRSASSWSIGLQESEQSIHKAYNELIAKSERFIYIENQFFVSNPGGPGESVVKNTIAEALKNRIIKAHKEKQAFKIIVIIPLFPGFEGDLTDEKNAGTIRCQVRLCQETISRGEKSLLNQLNAIGINPDHYIGFFGLRNHTLLNNVPKQGLIYIHSKLMIVDDRSVIIGSANINDRSMRGIRDSEICALIEDQKLVQIHLGGQPFNAAKFAHEFRCQLFMEHFGGFSKQEVADPASEEFWDKWKLRAQINTEFYRTVFNAEPDDILSTYAQILQSRKEQQEKSSEQLLQEYMDGRETVKGHIVEYPVAYLKSEKLELVLRNKEIFVPDASFT